MHLSYLIAPIIAKSYQASLTSAFTQSISFSYYLSFFTFIYSQMFAALLYTTVQCPIRDLFKMLWYKVGNK